MLPVLRVSLLALALSAPALMSDPAAAATAGVEKAGQITPDAASDCRRPRTISSTRVLRRNLTPRVRPRWIRAA